MTCHNCKHTREIARLADNPDEAERARLREICVKCYLGETVPKGSVSLDAIIDGTVDRVVDVAPTHKTFYTFDPDVIDNPATQEKPATIAGLSDGDAEKLRAFLFCVMGLSPLSFVAALHFARRGGRRRLAGVIRDFVANVRAYRGKSIHKATVSAKWKAIKAKIPELASVSTLARPRWAGEAGSVE